MRYDFVEKQHDRHSVGLGKIESFDRKFVDLLKISGGQRNYGMVAVSSPFSLHDIRLSKRCRKSCGRTAAHNVAYNARYFGHVSVADVFLFEGESGSACGCKRLSSCERRSDDRAHGPDLVLHLYVRSPYPRHMDGHIFRYLRGRGNGITSEEPAACVNGSLSHKLRSGVESY